MNKQNSIIDKAREQTVTLPTLASILIVDDQRFDRQRLRRLCDKLDFDTFVVEVDDLESMGTALEQDTFDLVILDYNLPDGTGIDAIPAIKSHNAHRQTAIIMITGQSEAEIAIEAMKRGCSDYIDKNELSLESLRRASVNALQKSSLSAGIEAQELMRVQIEKVLQKFSRECVLEIKPMLSRMMRQMRNLGDGNGMLNPQTRAELDSTCMRLWEFLTDLEGFDGKGVVGKEFPASDPEPIAAPKEIVKDPVEKSRDRPSPAVGGRLFSKHRRPATGTIQDNDLR